jgi:uncharacterized protein involved in exopolysaccharide biosynthesis
MEELSLADYIQIWKRRKKYFFVTFFILWAASLIFALTWSNYRSMATVEIEQPEIATDTTTPIGMNPADIMETLADLRISKIEQKVTAPTSLIEIITKFDLYSGSRKLVPMETIADRMSSKIKLNLVSSTVANPAAAQKVSAEQLSAIAFTLSYDYTDPRTAQQVTNELVTRFLDEDLKERHAQAEATSEFLQEQITAMEASMAEQEKKIAEFQSQHGVTRPESLMFNQQAAASTIMSMQNLDSQITTNEGTQGSLRAQLATVDPYSRVIADGQVLTTPAVQLKALEAQYSTLTAQYGPNHPDVIKVRHQIESLRKETGIHTVDTSPIKAQIKSVQTNLAAAQKSYGPDNPDVVSLQQQLKNLQDQLAEANKGAVAQNALKQDADNPAYLQLVAQLQSMEEQHKSLITQREALAAQQAKYQEAVSQDPVLEQQMASLTRDYDNAQLRYRELKEKKMAADMEKQMVEERKGERLIVINPPALPLKTYPSRLLLLIGGFVFALAGGMGSVITVQTLNQGVLGARHLTALVGVPPLVTIPHIYTENETSRSMHRQPYIIGSAIFCVIVAAVVFNFAVMPFDALWSFVTQHLGLS